MQENSSRDDKMKFNLIIVLFLVSTVLNAQDKYQIRKDDKTNEPMIVGIAGIDALKDTSFSNWFDKEYNEYTVRIKDLDCLLNDSLNFKIQIIMGTWCEDSRREIPRLIKILDTLKYLTQNSDIIYVDRNKKALDNEVDSLSITLVPTIIFYRAEKELGRITESPDESLEKDMRKIIGCE